MAHRTVAKRGVPGDIPEPAAAAAAYSVGMASLQELFTELAGAGPGSAHPAELLRTHGFELSAAEAAQALVSFAHSAPVEVAEQLQQYVMAHGPVPLEVTAGEPADGLHLLAATPTVAELTGLDSDPAEGLDGANLSEGLAGDVPPGLDGLAAAPPMNPDVGGGMDSGPGGGMAADLGGGMAADLGFGAGGGPGNAASTAPGPAEAPAPQPNLGMDLSPEPSWLAEPVPPAEPVTPIDSAPSSPEDDPLDS